jgi:hypothetical protein
MPTNTLQRWVASNVGDNPQGRALKDLQGKLGRTPLYWADRTVTTDSAFLDSDSLIKADTTGGSVVLTLPEASKNLGRQFTMKKMIAANTLTMEGFGTELIDNAANLAVTVRYAARTVQSNGVGWDIVSAHL